MIGAFKLRYPHVHNMADAGEILAGAWGREILGAAQIIFIVFLCGSHVLTGLIAFDTSTSAERLPWVESAEILSFSHIWRVMFGRLGRRFGRHLHGPYHPADAQRNLVLERGFVRVHYR